MADIATAMLRQAGGSNERSMALDADLATVGSVAHRFSVTGTASAVQFDQTPYYALLADTAEGAAYLVGAAVPSETQWSAAAVWRYMADNPAPLVNIHITDFNNTANLSAGRLKMLRLTPEGSQQVKNIQLTRYRTEGQYQLAVMDIPFNGEPLDGYTFIRSLFPGNATANTFNITFTLGETIDKRASVPAASPRAIVAPR